MTKTTVTYLLWEGGIVEHKELYHKVMVTRLIDLIGQLQDEVYGALHCDLKDVVCSFSYFHQTLTDHGTFNIISKVMGFQPIYPT